MALFMGFLVFFIVVIVVGLIVTGRPSPTPAPVAAEAATASAEDEDEPEAPRTTTTPRTTTPRTTTTRPAELVGGPRSWGSAQPIETAAQARLCFHSEGWSPEFVVAVAEELDLLIVYPVATKIEPPQLLMSFTTRRGGQQRLAAAVIRQNCTVYAVAVQ